MENLTPEQIASAVVSLLMLGLAPIGLMVYWRLFRQTTGGGSRVKSDAMRIPELVVAMLLITMFLGLMSSAFRAEPPPQSESSLLVGLTFYMLLVAMVTAFLRLRGHRVAVLFGFEAMEGPQVFRRGFSLILAAFPIMITAGLLAQQIPGMSGDPQEVVVAFQDAVKNGDTATVLGTALIGAIVAPVAEEFLFRGFLYGVLRRYTGIVGGILFTSALFAAIHMNLASLPALLVLAVCLNLAYESTGSLAVPMAMHAMFNFSQLAVMYVVARAPI